MWSADKDTWCLKPALEQFNQFNFTDIRHFCHKARGTRKAGGRKTQKWEHPRNIQEKRVAIEITNKIHEQT